MHASKHNRTQKKEGNDTCRKQLDTFGLKNQGMGKGLWNGNGGRIEPDECKIQGTLLQIFS